MIACPLLGRCGGCRPDPDDRLRTLRRRVEGALRRPVDRVVPSPREVGWRARVELVRGPGGRAGFHGAGSHVHVPVDACPAARPELQPAIAALPALPPAVTRVGLRTDGERVVAVFHGRRLRPAQVAGLAEGLPVDGVALGSRALRGRATLAFRPLGVELLAGPTTFFQVNLEVNARLVATVDGWLERLRPAAVLDLYGGNANLTLAAAARGVPVTLVESHPGACADARRAARAAGAALEVRRADADRYRAGDAFFDVAVLDPPRRGAPGVVAELVLTRPRAILVASCAPAHLPRDLRPALEAGYELAELVAFEMFPHTGHAEVFAVAVRPG